MKRFKDLLFDMEWQVDIRTRATLKPMGPAKLTFDPEYSLPLQAYRDPAWLAEEMHSIWRRDWVFATTEDALPSSGDQLPVLIGDQPVLLLRNDHGELVALSNLCAHRGTLLVEERTNAKRIQCPYHAWTYGDDGRLLGAPFTPRGAFDKDAHCLPAYRVESWHGLVFVSLNPDVEPLSERFAAVEPHVSAAGIHGWRHYPDQQTEVVWECNWKVSIQNAMESYHLFKVHRTTLEPYTPTRGVYYICGSARATATGGSSTEGDDFLLISLPPGFVGIVVSGSFGWQSVHPVDSGRCTVRTGIAYAPRPNALSFAGVAEWLSGFMSAASYSLADFLPEDKAICERIQRGATGDFKPGRLVPIERVVADFGHYLNWRLNGVEPPAVHIERGEQGSPGNSR